MVRQKEKTIEKGKNMSSGNKAKEQRMDTGGLYGSSTTGKRGTTYNPSNFERQVVGQTTSAIPQYLEQLINPTYDSQAYQNRQTQLANSANRAMENSVINPLAQRGLTRGSSVNQMSNQLTNKLTDANLDLMNSEDARVNNVLASLFNYYKVPYDIMNGLNSNSQDLYANALANSKNNNFGQIANAVGTIAGGGIGAMYGGPEGAMVGSQMGGQFGNLF